MLPPDQPLTPEVPEDGTIKIIGLGGVGSIVSRYLSLFLASCNDPVRLVLIDGDHFEPENASRMWFTRCGNKAAVVREDLLPCLQESHVSLLAIEEFVEPDNLNRLLHTGDIVCLTVDNHATRKRVNDYCKDHLNDFLLVSAGNDGLEPDSSGIPRRGTYGNIQAYRRCADRDETPSLTRYHPEIATPADHAPFELSCTQRAASTPQILFANLTVAAAMLNTLWLHFCGALQYSELAFDIADGLMRPVLPYRPAKKTDPGG
jgi:hypothetical protein